MLTLGPNYLALFDGAVPTTLLCCDGFSPGVYDEIQETVRAHYDTQPPQIDGSSPKYLFLLMWVIRQPSPNLECQMVRFTGASRCRMGPATQTTK